ncbi:MAG: murein L,D-transpeptidase catalytic domain family protein [Legionellaceae bacterium]|nr:murein L,D-transpeptidase catalytic domain family protein [Legionellaceae bacterium]
MNMLMTFISTALLSANLASNAIDTNNQPFNIDQELVQLSSLAPDINQRVLKMALTAYKNADLQGAVKKELLTVIDYSLPSAKERMWIFDLQKNKLLYKLNVAHGKNSGVVVPHHFSNKNASKESSLGTFVTKDTYIGSKGYSLNLQGLEKGFNDRAYARRVVMHGAWYVESEFIKKMGRAGRSWGCPSIAQSLAKPVINTIKGGSVIFAYYPDKEYLRKSEFVVA